MSATSIEWTDVTWNPVRGCSRVSEGCKNCYAERMAARMSKPGQWGHGLATMRRESLTGRLVPGTQEAERQWSTGPRWTGKVELIPSKLSEPLHWRKPRRVFVNSMSDLFHEALPDEDIAEVFRVMARCPQHTFQILTKRPKRMLATVPRVVATWGLLPNVWLGVSVEDQATADERILLLLETPAAKRFVSYEPALEAVNFYLGRDTLDRWSAAPPIDWLIVGGESGPGARPFDVAWARSTVRQCRAAGVACFVKQMGRWVLGDDAGFRANHYLLPDGIGFVPPMIGERAFKRPAEAIGFSLCDPKGGDPSAWPESLRVREFPA